MFSLKLLGGASLEDSRGPLVGRASQRHRMALLALLASKPGGLSRDKLIGYLWPEVDAERGRHLLSNSLYVLRQALGNDALVGSSDALRLDLEHVRCDVSAFEDALARGELERAVGLYAGPFLDGFFLSDTPELEQWIERERERLSGAYVRALEALAEAAEGKQDFRGAAEWWKVRTAQDSYDSRVALRLMQALDAAGNRAGALQFGALHQRLLEQELAMDAAPEIAALVGRLRNEPVIEAHALATEIEPPAPVDGASSAPNAETEVLSPADSRHVAATYAPWAVATAGSARRRWKWRTTVAVLALASAVAVAWSVWSVGVQAGRSIVVLPFVNMTPDEGNEYLSDGVTEEIITRLASVPQLRVISRTSAMHYKGSNAPIRQIANELNVARVLEGSVRQSGAQLRITVQLIDARADGHLFAATYDFPPRDLFAVQEKIAREVVRALDVELLAPVSSRLARQGTRDTIAYELYRRGRYFWTQRTKEGHEKAIEYYRQAIERDSSYAQPYAGLADAYLTAYQLNLSGAPEADAYSRVKWAAERALSLDDQSADAHVSFAVSLWWQRNWPGAERELRRALELNPGHASARGWYALLLGGMGRVKEALHESRRAVELDPFAIIISITSAWACYNARDYSCAIEQQRRSLELNDAWVPAYAQRGLAFAQKGVHDAAIRDLTKAVELSPRSSSALADFAYVLARAGRETDARDIHRRAKLEPSEGFGFHIARAHVALGDADSAFAWLERSDWQWPHRAVRVDPALDPLRSDPRFAQLTARVDREMGLR
jgi:TolB-like protein/DNA-binding SARP family transcriptional activator/Flp pilus assembly protein TadD